MCTQMVLVPHTRAQSRWDRLPRLLVIVVCASLGHDAESCETPLSPRGGEV